MNIEELGDVVAKINLGDNRRVDELTLAYWFEGIGHLDVRDALGAVTLHRQEQPGVWLDIGHVIAGARRLREQRERQERLARPALEPAKITLDREQHEAEFRRYLEEERAKRAATQDADPAGRE